MKKILLFLMLSALALGSSGCFLLVAGAAGAGTAFWLSEKLTQQFDVPYEDAITATEKALKSLHMPLIKQAMTEDVTQFRSKYSNGLETWVDVRRITSGSTKIEVRVGAVSPDKEASAKILARIEHYL